MSREIPQMTAERRERTGTRYAQRLRREAKMPAVLYGHGETPDHLALLAEPIRDALEDGAHLLELNFDGKRQTCLIKDVQFDYLGDTIIHVDLTRIDMTEEVTVWVPLIFEGEDDAPGLQQEGALLQHPTTDLEVTCLANAIPEEIRVDISKMEIGDSITVEDLILPEGVTTDTEPDTTVATISYVSEEEMEALDAETEEAAEAEPEVIGETEEGEGEGGEEGEGAGESDAGGDEEK